MKYFLIISVIAVISGLSLWYFFAEKELAPRLNLTGNTIVAFGDSLVEGVGAREGNDFVSLVSSDIGEDIINMGKSGDTTSSALQRLEKDVLTKNSKIVIILLGGNDYLQRISIDSTFENLETIVKEIQKTGAIVVLLGVRVGVLKDIYASHYKKLVRDTNAYYVPNVLQDIIGNANRLYDTIHPNDAGYRIIADRVSPVVLDILGK